MTLPLPAMKLRDLLEELLKEQRRLAESQIVMQKDIEHHIRRTDLLEKRIDRDLPPVKRHVELINGMAKVFCALIALAAGIAAVVKLFL